MAEKETLAHHSSSEYEPHLSAFAGIKCGGSVRLLPLFSTVSPPGGGKASVQRFPLPAEPRGGRKSARKFMGVDGWSAQESAANNRKKNHSAAPRDLPSLGGAAKVRLSPGPRSTDRGRERERERKGGEQVPGKRAFCRASYHLSLPSLRLALCRPPSTSSTNPTLPRLQMLPKMWKLLVLQLCLASVSSFLPSTDGDRHVAFLLALFLKVELFNSPPFSL